MSKIKLTPRLQSVADMVKPCGLVADIGTDHAYVPMYLVENGVAQNAIASDVVDGPVKIAKENIAEQGLTSKIAVTKAYGLKAVADADVAVIAGMGGKLICDILKEDMEVAKSFDSIVLQPMTCQDDLRKFLHQNGFAIVEERLAKEDDKIYNILLVEKGQQFFEDEFYYYAGKLVFDNQDKLLGEYLHKKAEVIKKRIIGMKKSKNVEVSAECRYLETLYDRLIKEASLYDKSC